MRLEIAEGERTVIRRCREIAESVRPSLDGKVVHGVVEDDSAFGDHDSRTPVPARE
jgi:hypothetical protein